MFSRAYNFVRARQLEGTYPGDPRLGVWGISYNRVLFGWGRVAEEAWPYFRPGMEDRDFNVLEPSGNDCDRTAKRHRIRHYQRVRNSLECRTILARNKGPLSRYLAALAQGRTPSVATIPDYLEMKGAFEITRQFLDAPQGIILLPPPDAQIIGSHGVPFLADLKSQRAFEFSNSWGVQWGNRTRGYMPYEFFDQWLIEAWATDEADAKLPDAPGIHTLESESPDPLGGTLYTIELYDADSDERIAWTFAVTRDGSLDIEEFFVRPSFRRQGFGKRLAELIRARAEGLNLPLRAWIPFADCWADNYPAMGAILSRLGLGVQRSEMPWAAYKASCEEPRTTQFPSIRIPAKPAHVLASESTVTEEWGILQVATTDYSEPSEPFEPVDEEEERLRISRSSPRKAALRNLVDRYPPPQAWYDEEE